MNEEHKQDEQVEEGAHEAQPDAHMPEQVAPAGGTENQPQAPNNNTAVVAIAVLVIVVILGALYWWGTQLEAPTGGEQVPPPPSELPPENPGDPGDITSEGIEGDVSTSDELADIEADLDATSELEALDQEFENIEAELDAALDELE